MKTAKTDTAIVIKPVEIQTVNIRIRGISPLIVHNWAVKEKREMLEKQTGANKGKKKHTYKLPSYDFCESLYWISGKPEYDENELFNMAKQEEADAYVQSLFYEAMMNDPAPRFGFPVTAIKQAAVMAASRNEIDVKTTALRGAFFIDGEGELMLAEIKGSQPIVREDMVRVGGISKTADIRYRAEFKEWYMDLKVSYNKNGPITIEQIVNLINLGGFTCGIGEWRPEKNGSYGMYRVDA